MGTRGQTIAKLSTALNEALADPAVRSRIADVGAIPETSTPEQYGSLIVQDQKRWGEIVGKLGLTAVELIRGSFKSYPAIT
jgi:tripartite-type tricarboxylate transporter receptor subunit TctC